MDPLKRFLRAGRPTLVTYLRRFRRRELAIVASFLAVIAAYLVAFAPPSAFAPGTVVRIEEGASAQKASAELAEAHVVAHPSVLRLLLRLSGQSDRIQTGAYRFDSRQDAFVVAWRLVIGDYGLPPVRITFVEGVTAREAAEQVAEALPGTSAAAFLALARPHEGYLFPDTYFFQPSADEKSIVAAMRKNFDMQVAPLQGDIAASGRSLADIVTMASLLEKEARTSDDRRVIAGILWNRIDKGMPLQVDAVFGYIFSRDTYSPSYADLKTDSPYNTYTHTGLPPGPISNPSLDAIDAALHPAATEALYYLSDKKGNLHTALTYAAHQANLRKYLQ